MTTSFCLRFSAGVFLGTALLHAALASWLGVTGGLLLAAPFLLLAVTTWVMRTAWVAWVALGVLLLLEACALVGYRSSDASTGNVILWAFAVATSSVQIPIAALVAAVRYFQNAE